MASVEQTVFEELRGDSTFAANFEKIGVMDVPSDTAFPYLTIRQVDDPSTPMGLKESSSGEARIQASVFSDSKYDCIDLRTTVREKLREITGVQIANEAMLDLSEEGYYEGIVDVIVTWVD